MKPRPIAKIVLSPNFDKSLLRLPIRIQLLLEKKIEWFLKDACDLRLKTHALKGEMKELHSFSVNQAHRVIFKFLTPTKALFIDIDTHEVYK